MSIESTGDRAVFAEHLYRLSGTLFREVTDRLPIDAWAKIFLPVPEIKDGDDKSRVDKIHSAIISRAKQYGFEPCPGIDLETAAKAAGQFTNVIFDYHYRKSCKKESSHFYPEFEKHIIDIVARGDKVKFTPERWVTFDKGIPNLSYLRYRTMTAHFEPSDKVPEELRGQWIALMKDLQIFKGPVDKPVPLSIINLPSKCGVTPLEVAMRAPDKDLALSLLNLTAADPVESRDIVTEALKRNSRIYSFALNCLRHSPIFRLLTSCVDQHKLEGLLSSACREGDLELVTHFLESGAKGERSSGVSALGLAIQHGKLPVVKEILKYYPNYVNSIVEAIDRTPLLLAARFTQHKIIEVLLNSGANPNSFGETYILGGMMSPDKTTPLIESCMRGDEKSVKLLFKAGANPFLTINRMPWVFAHLIGPSGHFLYSPLEAALGCGHWNIARIVVQAQIASAFSATVSKVMELFDLIGR
ncbi:MAG: ankyrin repeat domain-containing protein [Simkaniaceae bacterium]|nr:ankyrin repeat domain-containing protein [Simkaniaceae bacterium]